MEGRKPGRHQLKAAAHGRLDVDRSGTWCPGVSLEKAVERLCRYVSGAE